MYVFPELMKTADGGAPPPLGMATDGQRPLGAAGGLPAADIGGGGLAVWEALAWPESPPAWRPDKGEAVVVAELDSAR